MDHTKKIQEIASKLFSENKIDYFVGYQANGFDDNQIPLLVSDPADIPKLVFNEKSVFNLTNYLKPDHTKRKRVGIVVKGCDSRSLNLLLTESQVKRENLFIVGICCEGVLNEKGEKAQNCVECAVPDSVVYDEIIGTPAGKKEYIANSDLKEMEAMSLVDRANYFDRVFENCIRCNACRHSCPLCYCAKCCIDQETSTLYNGSNTASSAMHALMTWSLHLAGRCVDCRNCEKACPSHLPLHLLHKQNEKVIYDNFQQHLAGVEKDDRGAFYKYSLSDPDDFIM